MAWESPGLRMHQQSGGGQLGVLTDGLTRGGEGHCGHLCLSVCMHEEWEAHFVCEEEGVL